MAAVDGSSSWQMRCAASLVIPSFMQSSVWLARRSMASDWRARTESGSMSSRMTMTSERVNTMPATMSTAMLRYGDTEDQMSTRPDSTATVNMNISSVKKRGRAVFSVVSCCTCCKANLLVVAEGTILPASGVQCTPVCQSTPTSFSTSTTAATMRNPPKMKRSVRSGTSRTRRAPITAPGMEPTATAMPAI